MPAPGWLAAWTYAHRGLHGGSVPENSRSAFDAAIARGLGIELDVRLTSDGHAVVFHDAALARLTGEAAVVRARTLADLARLRLAGTADAPEPLADVLARVAGRVPVLVEAKAEPGAARLVAGAVVRALGSTDNAGALPPPMVAVMSFDPRIVRHVRRLAPAVPVGLVGGARPGALRAAGAIAWARPDFLAWGVARLDEPAVRRARARGLPVLTWTVRTPADCARGLALADALIAEGAGLDPTDG